jgi:hypothetical protein
VIKAQFQSIFRCLRMLHMCRKHSFLKITKNKNKNLFLLGQHVISLIRFCQSKVLLNSSGTVVYEHFYLYSYFFLRASEYLEIYKHVWKFAVCFLRTWRIWKIWALSYLQYHLQIFRKLLNIVGEYVSANGEYIKRILLYRTNGVIIFIDYCTAPRDT